MKTSSAPSEEFFSRPDSLLLSKEKKEGRSLTKRKPLLAPSFNFSLGLLRHPKKKITRKTDCRNIGGWSQDRERAKYNTACFKLEIELCTKMYNKLLSRYLLDPYFSTQCLGRGQVVVNLESAV